jgi:hypothetical protein
VDAGRPNPGSRYDRHVIDTSWKRRLRHVSRATSLGLVASAVLVAGPAGANTPEGWSDPEPVDRLEAVALLAGVPLLLILLITLAVYLPSLASRGDSRTGTPEREWFGGPRKRLEELAAPEGEDSKAGGASVRW